MENFAAWEDERTPEEIIKQIYDQRLIARHLPRSLQEAICKAKM